MQKEWEVRNIDILSEDSVIDTMSWENCGKIILIKGSTTGYWFSSLEIPSHPEDTGPMYQMFPVEIINKIIKWQKEEWDKELNAKTKTVETKNTSDKIVASLEDLIGFKPSKIIIEV